MNIRASLDRFANSLIRPALLATGLAAALALGGCNTGNNNLLEANRALTDRNQALTQQNESLTNLNQQIQDALRNCERTSAQQMALINDMRSGKDGLMAKYAELEGRFGDLQFGSLDPTTDAALRELASQHSDILEYDSARGMLRFKSDLTFASGSDALNENARSTLTTLAGILNGAAASYEIRVVGHTDSQRLSPATVQRHTSNIRLSADRAISVRNHIVGGGVAPTRVEIAGRGEFDPIVANAANGNTPQNRRVEIFLGRQVGTRNSVNTPEMIDTAPRGTTKPAEEIMK